MNTAAIDPPIARRLQAIATQAAKLTAERDDLIIRAHREGASLREIAAVAGITHVGVKKLLDRRGG